MKKKILTFVQILVTVGILAYIFRDPQQRRAMADALLHADPLWIIVGILFYGVVELCAAVRLQILLRVQGIKVGSLRLMALVMIGILFNQFMPGGVGGDVVKIYYLLKETPGKRSQALLAVLMDRLIGMLSIMTIAAVLIWLRFDWLMKGAPQMDQSVLTHPALMLTWIKQAPGATKFVYLAIAIFAVSLLGVFTSFVITGLKLAHKIPKKFPLHDKLVELSVAYNLYARAWKASLIAFLISTGVHFGSFAVFYSAAMALNSGVRLMDLFAVMPIINTVSSLPISVGGAGVREGLFQTFLNTLCDVPIPVATVISLTGAAIVLFWGLVGGVVYLFYRPSEHARLSVIEHEVEELEHKVAESEQQE